MQVRSNKNSKAIATCATEDDTGLEILPIARRVAMLPSYWNKFE